MSRHRLETYLDKVFGFSDLVSALPEGRQFPRHCWKKVFDAVFLGSAMQIPSLLQIEAECPPRFSQTHRTDQRRHARLRARKTVSRTGVRPRLRNRPPPEAQRNPALRLVQRTGGGGGRRYRNLQFVCPLLRCLYAAGVQHKVNGEMRTDIQYYHRIAVVVVVSTAFPIPLGVRFQKNGEGEVACALALLQDLVGQLGRRFLDVLVGDALYLQAPFVKRWSVSAWSGPSP